MPARMARLARVVLPGYPHHVTQRGVRSMDVFDSDRDRRAYLALLAEQGERYGVEYLAYCLMTNHVHLIAVPKTKQSLARGIGEAHRLYTRMINFELGVRGYLFQGRFSSYPMDEVYLLAAARYVERNPVRAHMVRQAWDYRWSSARFHVGLRRTDPLVKDRTLLGLVHDWRSFLRVEPDEIGDLRRAVRTGRPCGSATFIRKAERICGRRLRLGRPGRPEKKAKKRA